MSDYLLHSQSPHLILRFLPNAGFSRIFSFHLMPRPVFEPTSVEFHWRGNFEGCFTNWATLPQHNSDIYLWSLLLLTISVILYRFVWARSDSRPTWRVTAQWPACSSRAWTQPGVSGSKPWPTSAPTMNQFRQTSGGRLKCHFWFWKIEYEQSFPTL